MDNLKNLFLETKTAEKLYNGYAKDVKIIDYHCHIPPAEIATDKKYKNITELWLSADHYKWRLMRAAGIEEEYITANATDYEKFEKFAGVLEKAVGNPVYHWSHMELAKYFDFNEPLSQQTAKKAWKACNEKIDTLSARSIIEASNVEVLCTTDDPADSLKYHSIIADDKTFSPRVLPSFRPDNALNIESPSYLNYLNKLSEAANISIDSYDALCDALCARLGYFAAHNCVIADHGLTYVPYVPVKKQELDRIFKNRRKNGEVNKLDIAKYKTALLLFLAEQYVKRGFVMQLHFGCKRNNKKRALETIGKDSGFDCIYTGAPLNELAAFLNKLDKKDMLPKTILYNLDPALNTALLTIAGCFNGGGGIAKIQHGSAWWFNDHYNGIKAHLTNLSEQGFLAGFVGMLTDSRSIVSYTRHDYFRRVLCAYLGEIFETGKFFGNLEVLGDIAQNISGGNAKAYFGL